MGREIVLISVIVGMSYGLMGLGWLLVGFEWKRLVCCVGLGVMYGNIYIYAYSR
jgi:hypothetical protein